MANSLIDDLDNKAILDGTEQVVLNDSGADKETTTQAIANLASGGLTFARVVKSADETINNSTTLQDDDELLFTPSINKTYTFMILLWINSSAVANMKYGFSIPAGASGNTIQSTWSGNTPANINLLSAVQTFVGAGADKVLSIHGRLLMGATPGNFNLQWAQNTAEVSDTKVLQGSALIAWES